MIEQPVTVTSLIDQLLTGFDMDRETCERECEWCSFVKRFEGQ